MASKLQASSIRFPWNTPAVHQGYHLSVSRCSSIRPPMIHRGPRTVPKILSQWSSPVILGLGILPEHGLGIFPVPWMNLDNTASWDYLVHGPKGKGEQIYIVPHYSFLGTGYAGRRTQLWVWGLDTPAIQPLGKCCSRRIRCGWQAIAVSYHRGNFLFRWRSATACRSLL